MTDLRHETAVSDVRRRQIRVAQLIFAGAATVAALALFSASPHVEPGTVVASGPSATAPFATDDTNFVNDQGQTSGDIFTQNAQDQSSP
ncbi:MAG: hypothetical protein JWP83_5201 [Mycobacterium sp.]|jgi:hypothetical protein|nr:hypothetical protein [Mycobacterium sp.]